MWKATIISKTLENGVLKVTVSFSNGVTSFNEEVDMSGGSLDVLNQKVAARLSTLNVNNTLFPQIPEGDFAPVVETTVDPLVEARRNLIQLKQDIDLGIIKNTDQVYIDALSAAQTAYTAQVSAQLVAASTPPAPAPVTL